jgi:NAD-dependent SIR2 family protein deacetylase
MGFERLVRMVDGQKVVVLSGAGVSTESGIPDYRGPATQETRRREDRTPIQADAFMNEPETRRHYWARSAIGWPSFRDTEPNPGHRALARLEAAGVVQGIITQNVDRLHQSAGSRRVIELHGALAEVVCLDCGALTDRDAEQRRLLDRNAGWTDRAAALAPDGDADLPRSVTAQFDVPACRSCGGPLKPNVVFFGGSVPPERVDAAWSLLAEADVLLVTGSSLHVYSGYRFVRGAAQSGQPIGIVNLGPTRGDDLARVCVDGKTGEVLPGLADAVTTGRVVGGV